MISKRRNLDPLYGQKSSKRLVWGAYRLNQRHNIFIFVIIALVVGGLLTACQNNTIDEPLPTLAATLPAAQPTDVSETGVDTAGDEDTEDTDNGEVVEPTAVITEEVPAETEVAIDDSAGSEGGYSLTPANTEFYSAEDTPPGGVEAPAGGDRLVLVTVSFLAEVAPISVSAEHVSLIDDAGNTYFPYADGGTISPYIAGAELSVGTSLRGFLVFAIPEDATPETIEWCPAGNCDFAVESTVIVNE